jgi:endonuclease YncB( thermonuclease family)
MVRKLRLESIDTPEKRQAYGPEARDYCASLCLNKPVVVELTGRKTFDRLVARVRLRDGRDLARVMIENGMAWHYGKFSKDKSLAELQAKAKEKRLGLWSQAAPMPPWKWRKSKKRSRK